MSKLILVCGHIGAGKTTYALSQAAQLKAIRFSIDPWMQTLFSKDMTSIDYDWMIERVHRCYEQIWEIASQILQLDGNVVLDLGFTTKEQRMLFVKKAQELGIETQLHYINTPQEVRKQRVAQRNKDKDPSVYSFEVTDMMINFMEPRFEVPTDEELRNGCQINS